MARCMRSAFRRHSRSVATFIIAFAFLAPIFKCRAAGAEEGEPKAEPTYDGRTLAEWERLAVNDLKVKTRAEAMEAFAAFGRAGQTEDALRAIASAMARTEDVEVMRAGYAAMSRLGPRALPRLLDGLKSPSAAVREIVIRAMGANLPLENETLPEEAISGLLSALKDPEPFCRGEACHAFAGLGASASGAEYRGRMVAALVGMLKDESRIERNISGYCPTTVQAEAIRALGRLGRGGTEAETILPALIPFLERSPEQPSHLRGQLSLGQIAAIDAIGEIGPSARDALPALEALSSKYPSHIPIHVALRRIRTTSRSRPLAPGEGPVPAATPDAP